MKISFCLSTLTMMTMLLITLTFFSSGTAAAAAAGANAVPKKDQDGHAISSLVTTAIWTERRIPQLGGDIDGEAGGDQSGYSVSLSSDGSVVAIGAPYNDGNGSGSGHVRVYKWNSSAWNQLGGDIDGEAAGDWSGYSVSLSSDGSIVAIGTPYNDGNGDYSGHVRVYKWDGSAWTQLGGDIDGEAFYDRSGWSVSLSSDGSIVAIGAPRYGGYRGHVRVYKWNDSAWTQLGGDIDGETAVDISGSSVSLSSDGTVVAIGAPYNSNGNGKWSGHVRVYKWNSTAWNQLGGDIDGEAAGNASGYSVSLSSDGSIVAIGAPDNNGTDGIWSSGHVRVYKWDGSAWTQLGGDIDGEAAGGDQSGWSVSLSSDGSIVAIGAPFNDGNGYLSGHVRVYKWDGSAWTQLGGDIDGEAAGDESGYSVSLSSDGSIVAIGAKGNGDYSGHVRVYKWNDSSWITSSASSQSMVPSSLSVLVTIMALTKIVDMCMLTI